MNKFLLATLISASLLTTACFPENNKLNTSSDNVEQTTANSIDKKLLGKTWNVEDIDGKGVTDGSSAQIIFDETGLIAGSTGCNNFNAPVTAKDGNLEIGDSALTRKLCDPALNDQEQKFIAVFNDLGSYKFDSNGRLILKSSGGQSITATSN